jgi:glyoxylase-like metal-dependent hydrolase (beta-lactamase superfamily II)
MSKQLLPHLLQLQPRNPIPLINYFNCAVYVVIADDQVLVIDGGNTFSHRSILDDLEAAGLLDGRPIALLLTHCHIDHTGGAEYLGRTMQVCASPGCAALMRAASYRMMYESPELLRPMRVDVELTPGPITFGSLTVEVVSTPGHTDDCVSFRIDIDGTRCLFTGDLIMPSGVVGFRGSVDASQAKLVDSLRWLAASDFDLLCPGHDHTLTRDGLAIIRATLAAEEATLRHATA